MSRHSNHIQRVRGDPDFQLVKTTLERFLELPEKLAVLRKVGHIDIEAREVVFIDGTLMFPSSANRLRLPRGRAKFLPQLQEGLRE